MAALGVSRPSIEGRARVVRWLAIGGVAALSCAAPAVAGADRTVAPLNACATAVVSGFALCHDGQPLDADTNAALASWASWLNQQLVSPLPASAPDPGPLPAPPTGVFTGVDASGAPVPTSVFTNSLTGWVGVPSGASGGTLTEVWGGEDANGEATLVQATYDSTTGAITGAPATTITVPGVHAMFSVAAAAGGLLVLSGSDGTYWVFDPATPARIVCPVPASTATIPQIVALLDSGSGMLGGAGSILGSVAPTALQTYPSPAVSSPPGPDVAASATSPVAGYYYYVNVNASKAGMTTAGCDFAKLKRFAYVNLHFGSMFPAGFLAGGGKTLAKDASMGDYRSFTDDYRLASDFISAYLGCRAQSGGGALTVSIGVTNDGDNTTALGRSWATEVNTLNLVYLFAERYLHELAVVGSDDIEGGFGPPITEGTTAADNLRANAFEWLAGYESSTQAPFINTGAADSCPPYAGPGETFKCDTTADGGEDSPWNLGFYWKLGVTINGHMRMNFPQIYCRGQAQEWQRVSLWGAQNGPAHDGGKRPDRFESDLVQGGSPGGCTGSVGPYIANGYTATSTFLSDLISNPLTKQASIPYAQFVNDISN